MKKTAAALLECNVEARGAPAGPGPGGHGLVLPGACRSSPDRTSTRGPTIAAAAARVEWQGAPGVPVTTAGTRIEGRQPQGRNLRFELSMICRPCRFRTPRTVTVASTRILAGEYARKLTGLASTGTQRQSEHKGRTAGRECQRTSRSVARFVPYETVWLCAQGGPTSMQQGGAVAFELAFGIMSRWPILKGARGTAPP